MAEENKTPEERKQVSSKGEGAVKKKAEEIEATGK